MQPKIYNLRLNIDQVHDTIDGWSENRKNIDVESMELYDSQFADILDQFKSQGVQVMIDLTPPEDIVDDERLQAETLMMEIREQTSNMSADSTEKRMLLEKIGELNKLLFG